MEPVALSLNSAVRTAHRLFTAVEPDRSERESCWFHYRTLLFIQRTAYSAIEPDRSERAPSIIELYNSDSAPQFCTVKESVCTVHHRFGYRTDPIGVAEQTSLFEQWTTSLVGKPPCSAVIPYSNGCCDGSAIAHKSN